MNSVQKVAIRHLKKSNLESVKDNLAKELGALISISQELDATLDAFGVHFASSQHSDVKVAKHKKKRIAESDIYESKGAWKPELKSQKDIHTYAVAAQKRAKEALKHVKDLASVTPQDRDTQRFLRDAEELVKRFTDQRSRAADMVKKLTKKELPTMLKKFTASVKTMLGRRINDKSDIQIDYWTMLDSAYIWVDDKSGGGEWNSWSRKYVYKQKKIDFKGVQYAVGFTVGPITRWAGESTITKNQLVFANPSAWNDPKGLAPRKGAKPITSKEFVASIIGILEEKRWDGLKGDSVNKKNQDDAAGRKLIKEVQKVLNSSTYNRTWWSSDRGGAKIDDAGFEVEGHWRGDYHESYGYVDPDETSEDARRTEEALKKIPIIKKNLNRLNVSCGYGEKGHFYWSVRYIRK